ncbi:MAG: YhcH/YjgK/YiaL family protein [Sedimentisphaeraceae bacterium JB056]
MIVDTVANDVFPELLPEPLAKAVDIAFNQDFSQLEDGEYQVDGDDLFYIVQRYKTKPQSEGKLETHRKYIDLQFMVSGSETIGYAPLNQMVADMDYDEQRDVIFFKESPTMTNIVMTPGMYAIFYPEDGHAPGMVAGESQDVCKVVFKIKV